MRIHYRTTWDIETGDLLEDWVAEWDGPIALTKGGVETYNAVQNQKGRIGIQEAQQLGGQGQQMFGTLLPAYQSILRSPGYSQVDKNAMTLSTLGGIGAAAGSASDAANRRLASTGDPAGYAALQDKLARDRMQSTAIAEAGLQGKFADVALSERDKTLSALSNLYGIDMRTMADLLQQKEAAKPAPGFWSTFGNAVASGLGEAVGGPGG